MFGCTVSAMPLTDQERIQITALINDFGTLLRSLAADLLAQRALVGGELGSLRRDIEQKRNTREITMLTDRYDLSLRTFQTEMNGDADVLQAMSRLLNALQGVIHEQFGHL
jgi:hypothetical protein